jgi:hypothetical protein
VFAGTTLRLILHPRALRRTRREGPSRPRRLSSAVQSVSGFCLLLINAYKSIRETVRVVNESHAANNPIVSLSTSVENEADSKGYKASTDEKVSTPPGSRASSTPPLFRSFKSYTSTHTASTLGDNAGLSPPPPSVYLPPDYTRASLDFVAELLTLRQRFGSSVLLAALAGSSAATQPFLSKYLSLLPVDCDVLTHA